MTKINARYLIGIAAIMAVVILFAGSALAQSGDPPQPADLVDSAVDEVWINPDFGKLAPGESAPDYAHTGANAPQAADPNVWVNPDFGKLAPGESAPDYAHTGANAPQQTSGLIKVAAQRPDSSSANFRIDYYVAVGSAINNVASANYSTRGTAGQPVAAVGNVGVGYQPLHGFWYGMASYRVMLPLVLKS